MAINSYDIVSTLQALGMMKYWKGKHIILKKQVSLVFDPQFFFFFTFFAIIFLDEGIIRLQWNKIDFNYVDNVVFSLN